MIILDTMQLRKYIVFERGVFLVTRQAGDQVTPEFSSDKYTNFRKLNRNTNFLDVKNSVGV